MKTPSARPLTAADVSTFADLREPLSTWLRDAHGKGGRRAGLQGLASATVALVGIHAFGLSPLLAVLHALIALAYDGISARIAVQRLLWQASPPKPAFVSPGQALAFAQAVIAVHRGVGAVGSQGRLAGNVLPHAKTLSELFPATAPKQPTSTARWVFWVRWLFVVPVMLFAVLVLGFMALSVAKPLVSAAVSLFDVYDWWGLGLMLMLNLAHFNSTWRDLHSSVPNAPWAVGWLVEPPAIGQLIFWRLYKLLPLMLAMVVCFVLAVSPSTLLPHYKEPVAFAIALDAHLIGMTTGLFALLALLNLFLLAAPWHARRLIADLHSVNLAAMSASVGKRRAAS